MRVLLALAITASLAAPAHAQLLRKKEIGPPKGTPPLEAAIWPYPAPDPQTWWDDKRLKPPEEADPLGGRRMRPGERLAVVDNGIDPSTYRLWGLMPLQWQVVRGDETILEVWTRPATSVRQNVVRVTVRSDSDVFVQGRAGLACCEAGVGRRMGFDAKLPAGSAARFRALAGLPLWASPRDVQVEEPGAAAALCLDGVGYDITLVTRGRSASLHRACDPAEVGEAADVLEAVLGAALGHDPRFDVLFPRKADFTSARSAHRTLLADGGRLRPNPESQRRPPGAEAQPVPEVDAAARPPEPVPPEPGPSSPP